MPVWAILSLQPRGKPARSGYPLNSNEPMCSSWEMIIAPDPACRSDPMKWALVGIITCWSYAPGAPLTCNSILPQSEAIPLATLEFDSKRECEAAGEAQGRRILEWTRKNVSEGISGGYSIPVCTKGGLRSL